MRKGWESKEGSTLLYRKKGRSSAIEPSTQVQEWSVTWIVEELEPEGRES